MHVLVLDGHEDEEDEIVKELEDRLFLPFLTFSFTFSFYNLMFTTFLSSISSLVSTG